MLRKNTKLIGMVGLILFVFVFSGCATIVSGRSQNVVVETDPDGANVTIGNDVKVSPATFTLPKKNKLYTVNIEKDCFKSEKVDIKRGTGGWIFGNILFGGIIGVAVDWGTGSMYKLSPGKINQSLTPGDCAKALVKPVEPMAEKVVSKCESLAVNTKEWSDCMGIK